MTERKTFSFNWELTLPSAPKAKGACHFTIKDIFSKGIKHYFFMMVPQCWQQRIFKAVRLFWGTYNWTSVTDNFNIRYWFFFLSFLWRSEQRGQGRTSNYHQDHPPTWRSHKPSKWVEVSIVLSFTCSVLLCGFCIPHCHFLETDISLSRCRAKNVLNKIRELPASGRGK